MKSKKILKQVSVFALLVTMSFGMSATVFAGSEKSISGDAAKWLGGENSDGDLYSIIRDLKKDGLRFSGTVWVKSDDGQKKEKTGTTTGVGKTGQVRVSKASTHQHPTVKEKTGYKNVVVVKAEK